MNASFLISIISEVILLFMPMPTLAQETAMKSGSIGLQRRIDTMAEGIMDPSCTIILGAIMKPGLDQKLDDQMIFSEPFMSVLTTFALERVYVQEIIRSKEDVPQFIYVQWNLGRGLPKADYWPPDLLSRGMAKLMFLSPAKSLSDRAFTIGIQGSKMQELARKERERMDGLGLMKILGVADIINERSWFEPFQNKAIVETEVPATLLERSSQPETAQEAVTRSRTVSASFVVSTDCLLDLKLLTSQRSDVRNVKHELKTDFGRILQERLMQAAPR